MWLYILLSALVAAVLTYVVVQLMNKGKFIALSEKLEVDRQLLQIKTQMATSEAKEKAAVQQAEQQYKQLQQQQQQLVQLHADRAALQSQLAGSREQVAQHKEDMEQLGERFEQQFRLLAQNILEDKSRQFELQQETQFQRLLDPLRENLRQFKEQVEKSYKTESDERISMREQIRHMMELNRTLSDEAQNLTRALKGQVKTQGNWGEMILESILEYSGLQKNRQYFVQVRDENRDGRIIQPDVLVKYPDNRAIVIDSKVSLVHFERYNSASDKQEQAQQLELMHRSVKAHIDGLSAKNYQDVTNALDFVMLFVPVEAAYIAVLQHDASLWQYAYKKKILLISPTNLIAALKLVNDLWQRDAVTRNAMQIADRAGKLHQKLLGFMDNMQKVGEQIERAHQTWNTASRQLSEGKGNLVYQAEKLKALQQGQEMTEMLPPVTED
jgi:DNA recombination protein RmuC